MTPADPSHERLVKRPHTLHECSTPDELVEALRALGIDLGALVYEFVKPSIPVGILVAGSIADGVATEVSDLDVIALLPGAGAFKARRTREVAGNPVSYLPTRTASTREISLFLEGIEIDVVFVLNDRVDDGSAPATVEDDLTLSLEEEDPLVRDPFLNRLASGWVVHGEDVVSRWRTYYGTERLRIKWIATDFIGAVKLLEDMEAGIGRAPGHVSALGAHAVTYLMSSLLAYHHFYVTSANWMLRVNQLLGRVDQEMAEALRAGAELAFPTLLESPQEERAYFERVVAYSRRVRELLGREELAAEVIAAAIHDLDIIQ